MTKQELIASYCFRSHAGLHSMRVKEYAEIWYLLFESRVVDSKKNIKNEELYEESKRFLPSLIEDCENHPLGLGNYDKQVLERAIFYTKEAMKKVNLEPTELAFWQNNLAKVEEIASSIEYKEPEFIDI